MKQLWIIEERSGTNGRWYKICEAESEFIATEECKRLNQKNGNYYRVVQSS